MTINVCVLQHVGCTSGAWLTLPAACSDEHPTICTAATSLTAQAIAFLDDAHSAINEHHHQQTRTVVLLSTDSATAQGNPPGAAGATGWVAGWVAVKAQKDPRGANCITGPSWGQLHNSI